MGWAGTLVPRGARRRKAVGILVVLVVAAALGVVAFWAITGRKPAIPEPDTSIMQPRVAQAIRAAQQTVADQPRSADAWGTLGEVFDVHQLYAQAIPCYRRARALAPRDARWPYLLAFILDVQGGDPRDVVTLYGEAARLNPRYPLTPFRLGEALVRAGELGRAKNAFQRAIDLYPTFEPAWRGLGQVLLQEGKLDEAISALEKAADESPKDAICQVSLAQAYTRAGRPADAARAEAAARAGKRELSVSDPLRYEVESHGVSTVCCASRALSLMSEGKYREAIEKLLIVAEETPDDPVVHSNLAKCYEHTGQDDLAIVELMHVLTRDEHKVSARLELGQILRRRGQLQEAERHLRLAVADRPDSAAAHLELAVTLAQQRKFDAALREFQAGARIAPPDAGALLNWGTALLNHGDTTAAIQRYQEALKLKPDYADVHYSLGVALERAGRLDEALVHYREAVRLKPESPAQKRLAALAH